MQADDIAILRILDFRDRSRLIIVDVRILRQLSESSARISQTFVLWDSRQSSLQLRPTLPVHSRERRETVPTPIYLISSRPISPEFEIVPRVGSSQIDSQSLAAPACTRMHPTRIPRLAYWDRERESTFRKLDAYQYHYVSVDSFRTVAVLERGNLK